VKYTDIPMIHPQLTGYGLMENQQRRIRTAFLQQRRDSKARGIEFKFTYDDWINWWGEDILHRGISSGDKLVMARYGDIGCYEPNNCYKSTSSDNVRLSSLRATPYKRTLKHRENVSRVHKGKIITLEHRQAISTKLKGKQTHNAKKIITPIGEFASRRQAAKHYNVSPTAIGHWLKTKPQEFYYI
jgi:hypothetical protein